MTHPPPLSKVAAIACAALLVGLVVGLITYEWQWLLVAAAGFLTACVWAAAERHEQ